MSISNHSSNDTSVFQRFPTIEVFDEPDKTSEATGSNRLIVTLKYFDVDEYHADALKKLACSLPKLINSVRNDELEERAKLLIRAYRPVDPLADIHMESYENGQKMKVDIVREYQMLNAKAVAAMTGFQDEAIVATWIQESRIFKVNYYGVDLFPAFQFLDSAPLPVVAQVLAVFKEARHSAWNIAAWFTQKTGWLDDVKPVDLLLTDPAAVLDAAEQYIAPHY